MYIYFQVLKKLLRCLATPPAVQEVVADLENGVWGAVKSRLPQVTLRGCAFHWGQAVWRKIQELGLQVSEINITVNMFNVKDIRYIGNKQTYIFNMIKKKKSNKYILVKRPILR